VTSNPYELTKFDIQQKILKLHAHLDNCLSFHTHLIREIEATIKVILGMAERVGISKDSSFKSYAEMLAFTLSKFCFVQYHTQIAPLLVSECQPGVELSETDWKEFVKSEQFLQLKKKYEECMAAMVKKFNKYYDVIKDKYANSNNDKFNGILNDNSNDMDKVKEFLGLVGKKIVQAWCKHITSIENAQVQVVREENNKKVIWLMKINELVQAKELEMVNLVEWKQGIEKIGDSEVEKMLKTYAEY